MAHVKATTNYRFLDELKESTNVAVLEGSTRSSKTISIFQYLIQWCLEDPGVVVRCFRHDGTTHEKTTIPDFKWVMGEEQFDVWDEGKFNKVDKTFTFHNGSVFAFSSTSDKQKLHGCKQDIAWLNEAMEVHEDAWAQIAFRTTELTIMDYNPSFNHHWIFNSILTRPDVEYKHSTFRDNPFLSKTQIREIEKYNPHVPENVKNGTADAYLWDVYGLGKRGQVEGAVFDLFEVTDFFPEKMYCQRHGFGMDFGFSQDPSTLIECALFQDNLYVREIIYEHGLLITPNISRPELPSIEGSMKAEGVDKNVKIYADCAAPGAITDLQASHYNVIPCVKGPGSILNGISLMKSRKIFVLRSSQNIQLELEHYKWKQKQDGTWLREPIDKHNHAIDAIRYWAMAELQQARAENQRGNDGRTRQRKAKSGLRSQRR